MFDMKRREFITLLGGAVVAWPGVASFPRPGGNVTGFVALDLRSAAWVELLRGDCGAARRSVAVPVQPASGDIAQLLPEPPKSRRCVRRSARRSRTCSRRVQFIPSLLGTGSSSRSRPDRNTGAHSSAYIHRVSALGLPLISFSSMLKLLEQKKEREERRRPYGQPGDSSVSNRRQLAMGNSETVTMFSVQANEHDVALKSPSRDPRYHQAPDVRLRAVQGFGLHRRWDAQLLSNFPTKFVANSGWIIATKGCGLALGCTVPRSHAAHARRRNCEPTLVQSLCLPIGDALDSCNIAHWRHSGERR